MKVEPLVQEVGEVLEKYTAQAGITIAWTEEAPRLGGVTWLLPRDLSPRAFDSTSWLSPPTVLL